MKIHFYKILLCVFISAFSYNALAQNNSLKIDSLKKVLLTEKEDTNKVNTLFCLSESYFDLFDAKNCLIVINEALALSEKLSFRKGQAYAYLHISQVDNFKSDYQAAVRYGNLALKICIEIHDKINIGYCYLTLAAIASNMENRAESLKNFYAALKVYEEIKSQKSMAFTLSSIGFIYYLEENYLQSLTAFTEALRLYKESKSNNGQERCYIYIGYIYLKQKRYVEALQYDSLGLQLAVTNGLVEMVPNGYSCMGDILSAQSEISQPASDNSQKKDLITGALNDYIKALNGFRDVMDSGGVGDSYAHISEMNMRLVQFAEAQKYADSALQIAKLMGFKDNIGKSNLIQAKLDSATGNYKKAYEHYKIYIAYRDSLNNEETSKKSMQTQMQYEFDKKESIAKAAQDKKDADAKRIKNQQYFAIGALGIVVLAVVIIALIQFKNNKQKQKANNLITKQKQRVEATLTELKSTQAQLIQSEKMASLGELTAGIAHEIQNPLNFVNNFSEVNKELVDELQTELKSGNTAEALAISNDIKDNEEKINHHGKRADAIVRGMLQHSKKTSGTKEPTDINALADEYLRLSFHGIRAKDKSFNAEIKTDFDETIGKINIIPQDISRVLLNLYNNAFYAVNEKKAQGVDYQPTVSVSTKKIGNSVTISVSDNGNGIPQSIVDKIFQPFFTTKPTGQGTGLGLSLSYDIVKAHGGEIKVESKEGEGTEFTIHLTNKHA